MHVLTPGCNGVAVKELGALAEARALWDAKEPTSYSFTYPGSNPLGPLGGGTHVVKNGVVVSSTAGPSRSASGTVRTIEDVFARVVAAFDSADHVDVTYDDTYGFPMTLSIDQDEDGIDDENDYTVIDFTVREARR